MKNERKGGTNERTSEARDRGQCKASPVRPVTFSCRMENTSLFAKPLSLPLATQSDGKEGVASSRALRPLTLKTKREGAFASCANDANEEGRGIHKIHGNNGLLTNHIRLPLSLNKCFESQ